MFSGKKTNPEIKEKKVLFEITEEHLDTGLRGFPVGYCSTSHVDPEKGLFYRGVEVKELANRAAEDVIFFLYQGKEGTYEEINQFKIHNQKRALFKKDIHVAIEQLPREKSPMKLLAAALLVCGMVEGKGDYREDCLNIIAKAPELVASVINHHAGWGKTPPSKPELGFVDNFLQMINFQKKPSEKLQEIFRLFVILHLDHGGGNLSTFVGKTVSSGLEDMYGSLAAAMLALGGPRHGGANQECLEFVKEICQSLSNELTPEKVESLIRRKLENRELVFGFGHAVLRVEDPRATLFYDVASKWFSGDLLVKTALLLRTQAVKVLKENPKIQNPYPNVDAISGILLAAAGFNYPQYFPVLFGLSRMIGISIQIVEDRLVAREGKGTPIVRPKYLYKAKKS